MNKFTDDLGCAKCLATPKTDTDFDKLPYKKIKTIYDKSDSAFFISECRYCKQPYLEEYMDFGITGGWYDEYNNPAKYGNYKNGLKEGLWIERHTNSNLLTQMFYKNDVLDGKYTVNEYASPFDAQNIRTKKSELEELLELAKLGEYQDLVNDLTKQLEAVDYPKIIVEGYYVNGKKNGYWIDNRKGSDYRSKGNYINGNKDGTWTHSDSSGEVYKEEYEDGVLIKKKFKSELSPAVSIQCSDVITEEILEYQRKSGCTLPKDTFVCKEGYTRSADGKRCIRDS